MRRKTSSEATQRSSPWRWVAFFLGPYLLFFLVFQAIPVAVALWNSTRDYNLLRPLAAKSVGLENYERAFSDQAVINSAFVTILFAGLLLALTIPLALGLAVLVQQRFRGRNVARTAAFAPSVTSIVVISVMWLMMFNPNSGLFNTVLQQFGLPRLEFLADRSQALPSLVLMAVWQQVGFAMIIFLAGLQGIPASLLEAAEVDGAGPLARFRRITLPLLSRTILVVAVILTVSSFQTFAPAFVMTRGGPQGATDFFVFLIYRVAIIGGEMGYASALSILLVLFLLALSFGQFRFLRSSWEY